MGLGTPFATDQLFGVNLFKRKGWWSVISVWKGKFSPRISEFIIEEIFFVFPFCFRFWYKYCPLEVKWWAVNFFSAVSKPAPHWEGTVVNGGFKELKITDFKGKMFLCAHGYSCNLENWEPYVKSSHRFVKLLYVATGNSAGSSLTL